MRYFEPSDMRPGLTIHVRQRHMVYRVIEINGDNVKYESARGSEPWQENTMPLSVFTTGMEEVFAMVDAPLNERDVQGER